jgi:hypothetical protein
MYVYVRYNPAYNITDMELEENIKFPEDFEAVTGLHERNTAVTLNDAEDHSCLHVALMKHH